MKKLMVLLAAWMTLAASGSASTVTLFETNATWRYLKGTAEASSPVNAWRNVGFDDASWLTGNGAFYYDSDTAPATGFTGSTLLSDMNGGYSCIFLRRTFTITNVSEVSSLILSAWSDDGFIAWVNGVEVARYNMPAGEIPFNGNSSPALGEPIPVVNHMAPNPGAYLIEGVNVVAIQAFNSSISGSSDFVISTSMRFMKPDTNAPVVIARSPAPGAVGTPFTQISVSFDEPVTGVNAADLLINGAPATGIAGVGGTNFTFSFPQPPLGTVTISFEAAHGIIDTANPPNEFDHTAASATWQYTLNDTTAPTIVDRVPFAGTTVDELNSIQITFSEDVMGVDGADLLINGTPATNVLANSPLSYTFQFAQPATGTVSVAFAPGHGITDTAAAPNAFGGASWSYVLNPAFTFTRFVITEFLASNSGNQLNSLRDEDGDSSDWIEIYNPDTAVADLSGWFLTDVINNLTKWRFPNGTTVPARGYLVVFASGKNRTNPAARLHTNFQLNNSGEYLGLINPRTNAVSDFAPTYPAQSTDISYGRDRNNPSFAGYYTTPTPGAHNVTGGEGFGPEVKFSRSGSTFVGSFDLVLTTADPTASIYYTIVSTAQNFGNATNIPTKSSTLYTGPITITNTVQVRARAFAANTNFLPGPPQTELYVLLNPALTNVSFSLPVVVIHTVASGSISGGFPALDNSVIVQCFETNASGRASLTDAPQLSRRAGINLRGSSTQGFPKSSYAVELWDEFNDDIEDSFLNLPKESDWVLYAPNQFDTSLMHNPLLHRMGRDMGHYSSRTRFVEVFFKNGAGMLNGNTNATGSAMGDYVGVYVLEEKVKRDGNRVDIDELKPEHTNAVTITGGYLLKIDRQDGNERGFQAPGAGGPGSTTGNIVYQDPDGLEMVTAARSRQAAYLSSYFTEFNRSLTTAGYQTLTGTNHYSYYLDVPQTIDLHIANVMALNVDGYRLSGYITKPRNGKLYFGPLWDSDRGMGTSRGDIRPFNPRCWQATGAADWGTDFFQSTGVTSPQYLRFLFHDVDFWQKWIDRYQHLRTTTLSTQHIASVIDGFAAELREAQTREQRRWTGGGASDTSPRTGTVTDGNSGYSHAFNGTYQGEIDFQKKWFFDRMHFFDTNLLNRPNFSVTPGMVASGTMLSLVDTSGKAGTKIFYTLDGSDPRGAQGITNAGAIEYTGPITITGNVRIRARAVNANHRNMTNSLASGNSHSPPLSTPWSGDHSATFYTQIPSLIVTELMYHPAPPQSQTDTNDADNFEYIELKNIGATTLNLTGFQFTNGITFTFGPGNGATSVAPGDYIVVAKDLAAFAARYGSVANLAGPYTGNFDNGGERVTLVGAALEPILDFRYSDEWVELTDGSGFALAVVDETMRTDLSTNTSWRISSLENGSPGAANPPVQPVPVVLVNEALTHTDPPQVDTIELFNPGGAPADVSGWFLTDSFGNPHKFQIPNGTIIPAGGFVTFDETQFNPGGAGFALGSTGDDVYLFSASGGLLSGYVHGFDFGAAQNGVSFGRYVNSQGEEHFVAQAANSLGAPNGLPLVGPIVITEIMYHPPELGSGTNLVDNTLDEYIELRNIAATNVPLYHTLHPSNTWRLTSAVDFNFPTGVVMTPGQHALVVGFNPAQGTLLSDFRAKYGVPANVPVYGPWDGKLDNSDESVRLRRPDNPNGPEVPYILVDQVNYEDMTPWPFTADGFGASLQRVVNGAYGNDPTNWVAAAASAGVPSQGGAAPVITQQPQNVHVVEGTATNISIAVSSPTPVRLQWRLNGNSVPGATNSTLEFPSILPSQAGTYVAAVFNGGGSAFSSNAVVTVDAIPVINSHPLSQTVSNGSDVTFTVEATGTGALQYQWRFNGQNITGANSATFSIANAQMNAHTGDYDVLVTDSIGTRVSNPARLLVAIRPSFSDQSGDMTVVQGQNVRLFVTAGPEHPLIPLFYRWTRNGQAVPGADGAELNVTNIQLTGTYRALIANVLYTNIGSASMRITVLADGDGDGVPNTYETANGMNPNDPADGNADFDGDGHTNREEYIAGTNPNNAASVLKVLPLEFSSGNGAVLQFQAISNRTYTIDFRDTLSSGGWTNLLQVLPAISNRTVRFTNTLTTPMRVYRVTIPNN